MIDPLKDLLGLEKGLVFAAVHGEHIGNILTADLQGLAKRIGGQLGLTELL